MARRSGCRTCPTPRARPSSRSSRATLGARHDGIVLGDGHLHAQAVVLGERVELVDHLEARRPAEVVDGGQVASSISKRGLGIVAQRRAAPRAASRGRRRSRPPRRAIARPRQRADERRGRMRRRTRRRGQRAHGRSVPLERALAPDVDEPERRTSTKIAISTKPNIPSARNDDRPRVEEHDLDVEDDEEDRGQVELDREATPRRAARRVAALERLGLHRRTDGADRAARSAPSRRRDHDARASDTRIATYGNVIGRHGRNPATLMSERRRVKVNAARTCSAF